MRKISYQTREGNIEIEIAEELVRRVATRNGIPPSAVSDMMILNFFREASDNALARADQGYLNHNGTDT